MNTPGNGRKNDNKLLDLPVTPMQQQGHTDYMVSSIMSMIEQGILREGDMLPPERDLAQQFNVGRNTLREAIKVLEIYGVVDRAPRHGTVIRSANLDHIVGIAFAGMQITPAVFEDIQGYRQLIEIGIAPTVVERAEPRDWAQLEMLIARMATTNDLREQALWDYEFHLALVQLAGNAVLARSYRVLSEPMKRLMELGKGTRGTQAAIDQHRDILAALRARDIVAYTKTLSDHMKFGRQYVGATAAQAGAGNPSIQT